MIIHLAISDDVKEPPGWEYVCATTLNGCDHELYEDRDGTRWFVPLEQIDCPECHGFGRSLFSRMLETDDEDEADVCWMCGGMHYLHQPVFTAAFSEADHISLERQRKLLERRYGTPSPRSIRDYWMVQS